MNINSKNRKGFEHTPVDDIQSLIHQAKSYDSPSFNRESFRLLGLWFTSQEKKTAKPGITEFSRLKVWQPDEEASSVSVVVKTGSLEVVDSEVEYKTLYSTFFHEVGMTAFKDTIGLVFITEGDYAEEVNKGLFVPVYHSRNLRITSHIISKTDDK